MAYAEYDIPYPHMCGVCVCVCVHATYNDGSLPPL